MAGGRASREFGTSSGLAAVPAAAAVAEGLPAVIRHGDRVLQLDEAARQVVHRGFDRDDHALLERTVGDPRRSWLRRRFLPLFPALTGSPFC
jgi:hypothetical protein